MVQGRRPVSGANAATLTLNALKTTDAGNYSLVVSNSFGTNATVSARLTVVSGAIINGLVAHLTFDGNYSDSSGSGNDGSAVGSPTFQAGLLGQAVHLTSTGSPANAPDTNNYVSFGTGKMQLGTNDFSVSFWTKIFSQNDDKPFVSNKDWGSGGNPGWVLATESGGTKWNLKDDQSGRRDSATVGPQLKDGNWHNVVYTFIRNSIGSIYVDGQLLTADNVAPDAGKPIGIVDTALPVNIGQDGTGHYTDGGNGAAVDMLMDDLGIWNRALAPTEVASIYLQGQAGKDLTTANGAPVVLPATVAADSGGPGRQRRWQRQLLGNARRFSPLHVQLAQGRSAGERRHQFQPDLERCRHQRRWLLCRRGQQRRRSRDQPGGAARGLYRLDYSGPGRAPEVRR